MNWRDSLDRYLTTPPDDGFQDWSERVLSNEIGDEFYSQNSDWLEKSDGLCVEWLNILFDRSESPENAAKIIERAYNLFIKK